MRLKELIEPFGFRRIRSNGSLDKEVTGITSDSREVKHGMVFVAIKGTKTDGNEFIESAVKKGAITVVSESEGHGIEGIKEELVIVPDARRAMALLSSRFFGDPTKGLTVVGITGTNGKTTTAYLLEAIFKAAGATSGLIGTVNYRYADKVLPSPFTTPEAPFLQGLFKEMVLDGVTRCVMEVSSHAIEQKRTLGINFSVKVFTNLTPEHLDYHTTMEEYYGAKAKFFLSSDYEGGVSAVNIDDEWGKKLSLAAPRALTYSLDGPADVYSKNRTFTPEGIEAVIHTPQGAVKVNSPLIGEHNLYNIMASVSAAFILKISLDSMEKGINSLKTVPGRLEKISNGKSVCAYVDYAHTPDALERVIKVLKGFSKKRLITVFGCGGNRDRTKRPVMGKISTQLSDVTIITSDNPRDEDPLEIIKEIENGIVGVQKYLPAENIKDKGYMVVPDRGEAIIKAGEIAATGDIILVAGKGHEDYQIIRDERHAFDDRKLLRSVMKAVEATGQA